MLRRATAISAVLAATVAGLGAAAGLSAPAGARAEVAPAAASAAARSAYQATIRFTEHGIPHITARSFGSLGFGSGYATAMRDTCILMDTVVTARGQRSRYFGPDGRYDDQVTLDASNLQVDAFVTDLHNRRVVEKLLASRMRGPKAETRAMVRGEAAGVNRYLRTTGKQATTDPACRGAAYLEPNVKAIDVWYAIYLANELASAGVFVKEIVDADPPAPDDPGLPDPGLEAADFSPPERDALLTALGRDPDRPFGSNATAVGGAATTTGKGMLLGNPHFPWRGRYRFTQQQLTIPGRYDVAGASLIGSPAVNIGWNKDVAWSHTVSTAYRFTPYEYKLAAPTTYLTDSGPKRLMRSTVKITVKRPGGRLGTRTEDLYRTPQGYVVDSPATLMPWSASSVWAIRDANGEQLRTLDTFLDMGKAENVRDLLRLQDAGAGMPWVNTTAADRAGTVMYADHSVVPNVPDSLVEQCSTPTGVVLQQLAGLPGLDGTFASSRCAWRNDADAQRPGIFGPKNLPVAFRRDWVMNANDSYWLPNPKQPLEGFAGIIGCERCERTMRTRMVSQYVIDRLATKAGRGKESLATLASHEYANRLRAAEVMRAGGALDQVCASTGETKACAALKAWDGRSDRTSRGTALFEAFVARLPGDATQWTTPFSPTDPLDTPRGLDTANPMVQQAMADAIDSLRVAKIPFDAPWGSLQVAGDRGAPALPLGGGTGDAVGNANAMASRKPLQNRGRYRPVTYGSSHIQAVAFLPRGRVRAMTMLTYGQSDNPRSPYSSDQTRLFSQERWVRFAFTPAEIQRDLIRTLRVRGG